MAIITLTRQEARRIAISAQLLDADRPTDLVPMVEHLTFLQLDPTAAIAPTAHLVAWSRMGARYQPAQLRDALERDHTLFELNAYVHPMAHYALHRPAMLAWPLSASRGTLSAADWLKANARFRRFVLGELRTRGALQSRDIEDRAQVPWPSTGWTNNRNVTQMLEFLAGRGEVAIAGRRGQQRVWDLGERIYPADVEEMDLAEATRRRNVNRLRAWGIARPKVVGDAGEAAVVEGVNGEWRVQRELVGAPFKGRTALLSPFDRLVHDRVRLQELFGFDYALEMYSPKQKRRWGYYALPVLHGDRMVAKLDARADRTTSTLLVHAIHAEEHATPRDVAALRREVASLAGWLGLERISDG